MYILKYILYVFSYMYGIKTYRKENSKQIPPFGNLRCFTDKLHQHPSGMSELWPFVDDTGWIFPTAISNPFNNLNMNTCSYH